MGWLSGFSFRFNIVGEHVNRGGFNHDKHYLLKQLLVQKKLGNDTPGTCQLLQHLLCLGILYTRNR